MAELLEAAMPFQAGKGTGKMDLPGIPEEKLLVLDCIVVWSIKTRLKNKEMVSLILKIIPILTHMDEEQRRNAINSGICPPEPSTRRQLPNLDHRKQNAPINLEQGLPPPILKHMPSLSDTSTYTEGRNGGIPRTVPLTSLAQTLEQQQDIRVTTKRNDQYHEPDNGTSQGWREGRRNKPMPPEENFQDLEGYQDEEEEQNIDDYFEMIEKAISRPQQQTIAGGKKSAEIQRQLLNREPETGHSIPGSSDFGSSKGQVSAVLRQIDAYNKIICTKLKTLSSSSKTYSTSYEQKEIHQIT
ncbi:hypothetical protein CEXT_472641 [Caerostris extrusa]|uniref:Uncharacterized protein n=1 Tax=Caerostris extrusa TaxID=172846 RepID=A0AAV4R1Z5_CAEEX|nr:hypothetical protein CEXT_472641 [Caerostris extrusa]